jgi:hypothetical protein
MTLSIKIQSVGGHADYVVKVGKPISGILLISLVKFESTNNTVELPPLVCEF